MQDEKGKEQATQLALDTYPHFIISITTGEELGVAWDEASNSNQMCACGGLNIGTQ